jgi:hypothetical protein
LVQPSEEDTLKACAEHEKRGAGLVTLQSIVTILVKKATPQPCTAQIRDGLLSWKMEVGWQEFLVEDHHCLKLGDPDLHI